MLAIRSLARIVPRQTTRLTVRSITSFQPFGLQYTAAARPSAPLTKFSSPFSSTSRRWQGNEDELVVKLESEIQIEKQDEHSEAKTEQRLALENWTKDNGWDIKDVQGEEEVVLTKSGNGETISVTFSIDDINNEPVEEDEAFEDDQALADEPLVNQQADPRSAKTIPTAPEDQLETESEDLADQQQQQLRDPFPAKITINITKDGKPGALVVEGLTQYGNITFDDIWYFEDGKLSRPTSFDADAKRTKAYAGPPFGTLDGELAQLLESYLADRGINEGLAEFVTEYIEYKEAKEYQRWLSNVKSFFE